MNRCPILISQTKAHQCGFSLLEVLTTSIILSIGLLGLASLHVESIRKGNESTNKTMASLVANDMMERMRSNMLGVEQGFYETSNSIPSTLDLNCLGGVGNGARNLTEVPATEEVIPEACLGITDTTELEACIASVTQTLEDSINFTDSKCNAEQLAYQDVREWQTEVGAILPDAITSICRSSNPGAVGSAMVCDGVGNVMVISVSWRNRDSTRDEYRITFKP